MEYLSPKLDVVFKRLFGNEENKDILKDFLETFLGIKTNEKDLILKNVEIAPEAITMKFSRLDLRVSTKEEEVDIEVQVNKRDDFAQRSLYYLSQMVGANVNRGDDYSQMKRVAALNILDYKMFDDKIPFNTRFVLYDPDNKIQLDNMLEINFIELPKAKKITAEQIRNDPKMAWVAFFKAKKEADFNMVKENTTNMRVRKAVDVLARLSTDKNMQMEAQVREQALMEERSALSATAKAARAEGRAEGREEGREEGISAMTLALRAMGMSDMQIEQAIKLSETARQENVVEDEETVDESELVETVEEDVENSDDYELEM